jgi:hypothetical protein
MTTFVQAAIADLLHMNKDSLAALVRLGADAGNPVQFVSNADRPLVWSLIDRRPGFTQEPRTAAGSLD